MMDPVVSSFLCPEKPFWGENPTFVGDSLDGKVC